jgi:fibronectin-binding autotransporter adhesin
MTRIFRTSLLVLPVLLASIVPPSAHAIELQESAICWRMQSDDFADRGFSSGYELFYAGPEWFLNALSNPRPRNPFVRSLFDSAGDRLGAENGYVGTLRDVFDVGLFGNISVFAGPSGSKTSTVTLAALNLQQVWKNTAGNTDFNAGTSWVSGNAPGAGDVAAFTAAAVAQPNLSASVSISGLYFKGTGTSGYDLTRTSTEVLTLTATGTTIGAETGDANSVAIGAENTGGANTIDVPLALGASTGTSTFSQASGGTLTVNGVVSGSAKALSLVGGGTVQLSGLNTYTGKTTIGPNTTLVANTLANGGTASSVGQSSNVASNLVLDGGTLKFTGGAQSTDRLFTITTNGGTIDASGSGALTFTNTGTILFGATTPDARSLTLTGSNTAANTLRPNIVDNPPGLTSLIKNGSGTWVLTGTNTYTGGTTIRAGTLTAGNASAIGNGALIFDNNSTGKFQLNGFNISVTDLTFSQTFSGTPIIENGAATDATLTVSTTTADAFAGLLRNGSTGKLGLTLNGGNLVLYNTNTYSGDTTINAGTLTFNSATSPTYSGSANNSTIRLGSTAANSGAATLALGGNPPNTITSPIIVQASASGTEGTRLFTSTATTGLNTYGGSSITMNTGLTLQSATGGQFLLTGGTINFGTKTLSVNSNAGANVDNVNLQGTITIADTMASSSATGGSIVKDGSNTLIIQSTGNTYTGNTAAGVAANSNGTRIGGGVLGIYGDTSLGIAPSTATNNIFFTASAISSTTDPTLQDTSGDVTLAATRNINIASGVTARFDSNNNIFTIGGVINGGGNLNKIGGGSLVLTGANSYTGATTVSTNGGTLEIANNNSATSGRLTATSGITVNAGGTLLLSGSSSWTDRINDSSANGFTLAGGTFNTGGLSEVNGVPGSRTPGIGALTLTANSTIDFGSGASVIEFSGLGSHTPIVGPNLAIIGWTGTANTPGGTDQLLFAGLVSDFLTKYDQSDVSFNNVAGYSFFQITPDYYEITMAPEPSTWIGGALALAAIGCMQRRRIRRLITRRA